MNSHADEDFWKLFYKLPRGPDMNNRLVLARRGTYSPAADSTSAAGFLYIARVYDALAVAVPCFSNASARISAISITLKRSSASTPLTPSSNIVMQKGQAAASTSAPVSSAWLTRLWLTRLPIRSSIQARPPPPPQQKLLLRLRRISVMPLLSSTLRTRRGCS